MTNITIGGTNNNSNLVLDSNSGSIGTDESESSNSTLSKLLFDDVDFIRENLTTDQKNKLDKLKGKSFRVNMPYWNDYLATPADPFNTTKINLNQVSGFGPDVMYYLSRLSGSKILLNIHPTDSYGWDPAAVMTEAYNWQKDFDSDLIMGWQANDLRKAETHNVRESATGSEPKFNKIIYQKNSKQLYDLIMNDTVAKLQAGNYSEILKNISGFTLPTDYNNRASDVEKYRSNIKSIYEQKKYSDETYGFLALILSGFILVTCSCAPFSITQFLFNLLNIQLDQMNTYYLHYFQTESEKEKNGDNGFDLFSDYSDQWLLFMNANPNKNYVTLLEEKLYQDDMITNNLTEPQLGKDVYSDTDGLIIYINKNNPDGKNLEDALNVLKEVGILKWALRSICLKNNCITVTQDLSSTLNIAAIQRSYCSIYKNSQNIYFTQKNGSMELIAGGGLINTDDDKNKLFALFGGNDILDIYSANSLGVCLTANTPCSYPVTVNGKELSVRLNSGCILDCNCGSLN